MVVFHNAAAVMDFSFSVPRIRVLSGFKEYGACKHKVLCGGYRKVNCSFVRKPLMHNLVPFSYFSSSILQL